MGKSTISTGPFSIAFCMFTRGYIFEGDQRPNPHGFPVFFFPTQVPTAVPSPTEIGDEPTVGTVVKVEERVHGGLLNNMTTGTTRFLPLNPGYRVDKMGLKKHQKRRWVRKTGYVTTFGTTMLHQLIFIFLGKAMGFDIQGFNYELVTMQGVPPGLPNQFLSGWRSNVTFVEKMVSLIILFSGPGTAAMLHGSTLVSCKAAKLEKSRLLGPYFLVLIPGPHSHGKIHHAINRLSIYKWTIFHGYVK